MILPVPNRLARFLAILSVSEFLYMVSARLRIEHLDIRLPFLPNICVWLSEKANRCSTLTRRHRMLKRTHSHFCRTCARPGLCWPSHFEASLRNDPHVRKTVRRTAFSRLEKSPGYEFVPTMWLAKESLLRTALKYILYLCIKRDYHLSEPCTI